MGLLHAAILHRDNEDTVVDALVALGRLVDDRTTTASLLFSEPRWLAIFADLLWRHATSDRPEAPKNALLIIAQCSPSNAFYGELAKAGFIELATSLLRKHMYVPSIAYDTAVAFSRIFPVEPPPRSKAAELAALLMAVIRRYDSADAAGFDARDLVPSSVIGSAMHALALLNIAAPTASEHLAEGSNAFQLVDCMRRHMADPLVAAAACEVLSSLARAQSRSVVMPLVLAGAVPLLLAILEAYEANRRAVIAGGQAFAYLACDAATRLQLAEEAPVRLLRRLLRRHVSDPGVASELVSCIFIIAQAELGRVHLVDGDAAPETLALLLEAARIHRGITGEKSIVAVAFAAVAATCDSHDRVVAAHKAGAGAAALSALSDAGSRSGDERAASHACEALANMACLRLARDELFPAGAPALMLRALKRYTGAGESSADVARSAWGALRHFFEDHVEMGKHPKVIEQALPLLLAALERHTACAVTVCNAGTCLARMIVIGRPSLRAAAADAAPLQTPRRCCCGRCGRTQIMYAWPSHYSPCSEP